MFLAMANLGVSSSSARSHVLSLLESGNWQSQMMPPCSRGYPRMYVTMPNLVPSSCHMCNLCIAALPAAAALALHWFRLAGLFCHTCTHKGHCEVTTKNSSVATFITNMI